MPPRPRNQNMATNCNMIVPIKKMRLKNHGICPLVNGLNISRFGAWAMVSQNDRPQYDESTKTMTLPHTKNFRMRDMRYRSQGLRRSHQPFHRPQTFLIQNWLYRAECSPIR